MTDHTTETEKRTSEQRLADKIDVFLQSEE